MLAQSRGIFVLNAKILPCAKFLSSGKAAGRRGTTRAASKQGFLCAEYENIAMCKIFVFGQSSGQMGTTCAAAKQGDISVLKENNIAMRDTQNERNAIKFIGGIRY